MYITENALSWYLSTNTNNETVLFTIGFQQFWAWMKGFFSEGPFVNYVTLSRGSTAVWRKCDGLGGGGRGSHPKCDVSQFFAHKFCVCAAKSVRIGRQKLWRVCPNLCRAHFRVYQKLTFFFIFSMCCSLLPFRYVVKMKMLLLNLENITSTCMPLKRCLFEMYMKLNGVHEIS